MARFKNIKLNTVFIAGVIAILGFAMFFLSFAAIESIITLGYYVTEKVTGNIKQEASELFLINTKDKAEEYSDIFRTAADLARVYGERVAFIYNKIDKFNFGHDAVEKYRDTFFRKKPGGNLYNVTDKNYYIVYAGKDEKLPLNTAKLSLALSYLKPLFVDIDDSYKFYDDIFLFLFDHDYLINYAHGQVMGFLEPAKMEDAYFDRFKRETLERGKAIRDIFSLDVPQTGNSGMSGGYRHFNSDGQFVFYSGIDIALPTINEWILKYQIPILDQRHNASYEDQKEAKSNVFSYIFNNKDNVVIVCPKDLIKKSKNLMKIYETNSTSNETAAAATPVLFKYSDMNDPAFFQAMNRLANSKKDGIVYLKYRGRNYIAAFAEMDFNNWVLCTAVPVDLLMEPVKDARDTMNATISVFKRNFIFLSIFFLVVSIFLIIVFFRKYLIVPIARFSRRTLKMGKGNFGITVLLQGTSEVKELGYSFNCLGGDLRTYMKNVEIESAKKDKIINELKVAREMQQAILPRVTTTYKDAGIDLYAELRPAKEIAGDFYDFFFLSDKKIALLIADVSGKGVSAAFFMSVAKRILRNVCISEPKDPSKAMKASNEILASYNVNMFVTVLLIYYDLETGKFKYANGGHNEALLLNPSGEFRYFGCLENAVIGFLPELEYKSAEGIINPGDTLVLYTDGITEANAPSEEEFGETRLAEFIVKNKDCKADQIVKGLIQHVHEFEQGNQFDDITVLVFKRER